MRKMFPHSFVFVKISDLTQTQHNANAGRNSIALKFETFITVFSSLKTHGIRQYKYIYSFGARPIWVMGGQTNDKQGCKVVLGGVLGPFKAIKRE